MQRLLAGIILPLIALCELVLLLLVHALLQLCLRKHKQRKLLKQLHQSHRSQPAAIQPLPIPESARDPNLSQSPPQSPTQPTSTLALLLKPRDQMNSSDPVTPTTTNTNATTLTTASETPTAASNGHQSIDQGVRP